MVGSVVFNLAMVSLSFKFNSDGTAVPLRASDPLQSVHRTRISRRIRGALGQGMEVAERLWSLSASHILSSL